MWILEKTADFVDGIECPLNEEEMQRINIETSYDHGRDRWRIEFFSRGVRFGRVLFEDRRDYLYFDSDDEDDLLWKELARVLVEWAKLRKSQRSPGFVSDFDTEDEVAVDWYFQSFGLA